MDDSYYVNFDISDHDIDNIKRFISKTDKITNSEKKLHKALDCLEYFIKNELIDLMSFQVADEKSNDEFEDKLFIEWISNPIKQKHVYKNYLEKMDFVSFEKRKIKSFSERIKLCYNLKLDQSGLNSEFSEVVRLYSLAKSVPVESLYTGIFTSVSCLASNATVHLSNDWETSLSLYTCISGLSGSNKSTVVEFIKNSFCEMEDFFNIDPVLTTCVNNSITVESLIEQLTKNPNQIQYWDEINTLFESFGLYNSKKEFFDKSVFNNLSNGSKNFKTVTKKLSANIDNPRLAVFGAGHPPTIIKYLDMEDNIGSDGFLSRFLICNPKPIRQSLIGSISNEYKYPISLRDFFCVFKLFSQVPCIYTFTDDSINKLNQIVINFNEIIERNELNIPYLGFLFAKSKTHLIKLSAIIHLINSVFSHIKNIPKGYLDDSEKLTLYISSINKDTIIQIQSVEAAYTFLVFYIKSKLLLVGYDFDDMIVDASTNNDSGDDSKSQKQTQSAKTPMSNEKHLLLMPGTIITSTDFCKTKPNLKIEHFKKVCSNLLKTNLGKVIDVYINGSRKKSFAYMKTNVDEFDIEEELQFINDLSTHAVGIADFKKSFRLKNKVDKYKIIKEYELAEIDDEDNESSASELETIQQEKSLKGKRELSTQQLNSINRESKISKIADVNINQVDENNNQQSNQESNEESNNEY